VTIATGFFAAAMRARIVATAASSSFATLAWRFSADSFLPVTGVPSTGMVPLTSEMTM